jgi:MOSC domain-containing protein YiiM
MRIHTLSIGVPETREDERGPWKSAIHRQPAAAPVMLGERGHAGDRVADRKHHGSPDQAVCAHPLEHYAFWNAEYDTDLFGPAVLGENWTLSDANEANTFVGDVYRVGAAVVQVSAPRVPCWKQERKVQLSGFLRRANETQRTGWYLRVLTPGEVRAGDELVLLSRPERSYTVAQVNENFHGRFDPAFAEELLLSPELAEGWKEMLRSRLSARNTEARR